MREIKEEVYGIIYKATNKVNGKVYIGQTTKSLQIRKAAHIRNHTQKQYDGLVFYKAMKKYNPENFEWETIEKALSKKEINEKEVYWISHYKANEKGGYNMTAGGHGVKSYKVTKEGIQRRKDVFNKMWANGHAATVQRGEEHASAKLKNVDVRKIVDLLIEGKLKDGEIATKLSVSPGIISSIKLGKAWNHIVTEEERHLIKENSPNTIRDLSEKDVLDLKYMLLNTNIPSEKIYAKFNISVGAVNHLLYHSKWTYLFTEEEVKITRNRRGRRELTLEEVIEIKEMLQDELYTYEEIAIIFNIKIGQVRKIAQGQRWGNVLIDLPMEDIEDYEWKFIDWKPQKPNRKY